MAVNNTEVKKAQNCPQKGEKNFKATNNIQKFSVGLPQPESNANIKSRAFLKR